MTEQLGFFDPPDRAGWWTIRHSQKRDDIGMGGGWLAWYDSERQALADARRRVSAPFISAEPWEGKDEEHPTFAIWLRDIWNAAAAGLPLRDSEDRGFWVWPVLAGQRVHPDCLPDLTAALVA